MHITFSASHLSGVWDSVAFTAQPNISLRAQVSPQNNAIFRVAPVFQQSVWAPIHGAPSTGAVGMKVTNWTTDTTTAVRVITR